MVELRQGSFWLQLSLDGMGKENSLQVLLPKARVKLTVWELFEWLFHEEPQAQALVEAMLDRRANPDLPDIYAVFLDVFHQWRLGHCALFLSTASGDRVALEEKVTDRLKEADNVPGASPPAPTLALHVVQKYRPLEYAVASGAWDSQEELLAWLRSLTLLYFLDKHNSLPDSMSGRIEAPLAAAADLLEQNGIIEPLSGPDASPITPEGRRQIGALLDETEAYIDQYDLFKDVVYDALADTVEFGTGRGQDLRVQVFQAEGLDPVRVVFLLRLYDGTLDEFVSTWRRQVCDPEFFDRILEPVVNHDRVDDAVMGRIIEAGLAYGEELREMEQLEEWRRDVRATLRTDQRDQE